MSSANDVSGEGETKAAPRESWASAAYKVFVESILLGFLAHIGAILLLLGAILATQSKFGILVLLLGVVALFGYAMRGMASWPIWKRDMPPLARRMLWLICYGVPILIVLAICGITGYAVFILWP